MSKELVKPVNTPMKVRLVRYDSSNWYGENEIGNEYEVLKVNIFTYTIKTADKYSNGLFKEHCEIIYPLPQVKILTEEELKEIEDLYNRLFPRLNTEFPNVVKLIASHRELLAANAELSFQIMNCVRYEGFLRSVIHCKGTLEENEDFDWFKERMSAIEKSLEGTK